MAVKKLIKMTTKQFRKSVSQTCRAVMSKHGLRYKDIDINSGYSVISVGILSTVFYAQGDSADEFINEAEKAAEKTGLNEKTCLLWYLDIAGAL